MNSFATIINGRKLAEDIKHDLRQQIVNLGLTPALAVILVGNDPASHLYVKLKTKACRQIGIEVSTYLLDTSVPQEEVHNCITWLNQDPSIDAILLQLPLPKHLDTNELITAIAPEKDADGFHPTNLTKLQKNQTDVRPAPAQAVLKLIDDAETSLQNKQAVVIANNDIFSQPIKLLLERNGATVDYIKPSDTVAVQQKTPKADIVIVAVGKPKYISADLIKKNAIVIDVGTNKIGDVVVGDVDYDRVAEVAGAITPVPGGVGPMTIACLLENVVVLHQERKKTA